MSTQQQQDTPCICIEFMSTQQVTEPWTKDMEITLRHCGLQFQ